MKSSRSPSHPGEHQPRLQIGLEQASSLSYKIYHKDLAADTTDNGVVAPLVLESGDIVKIQVATANKIEGMISYLEIFDEKSA